MNLTEKEKLVFYGLVRWPDLNDSEISEKIDVKRPTIASIRKRFEREQLYEVVNIPNFEKLGCELLTVRYAEYNPLTPYEVRKPYAEKIHRLRPDIFFDISTDTQNIWMSSTKDFTTIKKRIDYVYRSYAEQGFINIGETIHVFFPFSISKIYRFFDYAPLLRKLFNLREFDERTIFDT